MRIWNVIEDGCVGHWVMADIADTAKEIVANIMLLQNGRKPDDSQLRCEQLHHEKDLALCGDTIPIKHTVQEWLCIYDGMGPKYLACTEF